MGTVADTAAMEWEDRAVLTHGLQLLADIFFPPASTDSFHSEVSSSPDLLHSLLTFLPRCGQVLTLKFSAENPGSKLRGLRPPNHFGYILAPVQQDTGH